MKKLFALVLVLVSGSVQAGFIDEVDFPSWSEEAIELVYETKIMTGFGDGSFRPKQNLNRAEAVTLLLRAKKMEDENFNGVSRFGDVPGTAWFAKAVAVAEGNGWLTGKADGKFHPGDVLNRAEFSALIDRSYDLEALDEEALPFDDVLAGTWFYEPVKVLYDRELLRNARNKYFRPEQSVTRAEAAWVFAQILSKPGVNGESGTNDFSDSTNLNSRRVAIKPRDFNPDKQSVDTAKLELLLEALPLETEGMHEVVRGNEEWTTIGSIRMSNNLTSSAEMTSLNLRLRFEANDVGPEENLEARLHGPGGYEKIVPVSPSGDSLFPGLGIRLQEGDEQVYWLSYRTLPDRTYFPRSGSAMVIINDADGLYFEAFTSDNASRTADVRPVPVSYGERLVGEFEFKLNADE